MSEKVYSWLLRLYPADFRKEYGEEALQLFRDRLRDETRRASRVRMWFDVTLDLATSLPHEYLRSERAVKVIRPERSGPLSFFIFEERGLGPGPWCAGALGSTATFLILLFAVTHAQVALSREMPFHIFDDTARSQRDDARKALSLPAAQKLQAWVEAVNSGDRMRIRTFYAERSTSSDDLHAEDRAQYWLEIVHRSGAFAFRKLETSTGSQVSALAQTSDGLWWRLALTVMPDDRHSIRDFRTIRFGAVAPGRDAAIPSTADQTSEFTSTDK